MFCGRFLRLAPSQSQKAAVALADLLVGDGRTVEAPGQQVLQTESSGAARTGNGRGRATHPIDLVALRAPAHPSPPQPRGPGVYEPSSGGAQTGRFGGPDGVVPVMGAYAGVGDLVQDRLADLGFVVQAHEVAAECESASRMVSLTRPAARSVEAQLPVADAGLLHEGVRQAQDVGKIHGPTLCTGGPASSMVAPVIPGASRRQCAAVSYSGKSWHRGRGESCRCVTR